MISRTPLVSSRSRTSTPSTQTHLPSFTDPGLLEDLRSPIPLEKPSTSSTEPTIEEDLKTPVRNTNLSTSTGESTMAEEGGGGVLMENTHYLEVEAEVEEKEEEEKEVEVQKEEEVEEKWEALLGSL